MKSTVIREIAHRIIARANCARTSNAEWFANHTEVLELIAKNELPSGSGIDSGCKIDLDRSSADKIVITTSYHHMNDGGYYDGWTDHEVIVTPSLAFGFDLRITGRNRNDIKEYLHEVFHAALSAEINTESLVAKVA